MPPGALVLTGKPKGREPACKPRTRDVWTGSLRRHAKSGTASAISSPSLDSSPQARRLRKRGSPTLQSEPTMNPSLHAFLRRALLISVAAGVTVVVIAGVYVLALLPGLPGVDKLQEARNAQPSVLLALDGTPIAR